jgi:hypothetical protein
MYDDQESPTSARLVLFVVAALLALALPVFLVSRVLTPHNSTASLTAQSTTTSRPAAGSTSRPASASARPVASAASATQGGDLAAEAESCRLGNLREQAAMGTAAASLEQFQKHIDAMNLLVEGKITLAVAMKFWDQTRLGAEAKVAEFRAADQALTAGKATCPELGPTAACTAPLDRVNAITACAKAERARLTVVGRARVAVATWEHHVHDMERLRKGEITPAQATALWQKNWRTGQKQVDAYLVASQLVDSLKCPLT